MATWQITDNEELVVRTPIIETPRLKLRAHRLEDLDAYNAMWGDSDVVRYIGGTPFNAHEVWQRFLRNRGHWVTMGYGYWVMEERATGRFLGELGFANFRRPWSPAVAESLFDVPEAGWVLAPAAHGAGIASEATAAIHDWADTVHDWKRTFCCIAPGNGASIRVAEKLGYVERFTTLLGGKDTLVFERARG